MKKKIQPPVNTRPELSSLYKIISIQESPNRSECITTLIQISSSGHAHWPSSKKPGPETAFGLVCQGEC